MERKDTPVDKTNYKNQKKIAYRVKRAHGPPGNRKQVYTPTS